MGNVDFISKSDFHIEDPTFYAKWIRQILDSEDKICGDISYTFCDDEFLDKLNQEYLHHEDYTDILSFDDTIGEIISGDIFISVQRVAENAEKFEVDLEVEMRRVMAHGILHYCGYDDHSSEDIAVMREKEAEKMAMFHVEQSKN